MAAPGVYQTKRKDGTESYRASITLQNKHISLGSFGTETEANQAYTDAGKLYRSTLLPKDYSEDSTVLSFGKFISIINLRDNGIYIKTPIILGPKFFSYYLSEDYVLLFDIDDLFFYSTHTIMKRGNHLFVADYGMQINILSRYGIHEHAVLGRDYIFANGNSLDLRYSNIIILNRYYGVTKIQKKNRELYKAKIHLHGDYVIGTYATAEEAAIAYNKAADIVKKNGCKIDFQENYPEGISNREYASIYQKVSISEKILQYKFN